MITRRKLLVNTALLAGLAPLSNMNGLLAGGFKKQFKIGACDWSIGKSSDIGAFQVAKEIGLDGIMVNIGSEKNNLHLRNPDLQKEYLQASSQTGVKISSLAISELNNIPYKSDPRTDEWVWDSVDVAKSLNVPVILLAFFNKNDLRNDDKGKQEVVRKLKLVAPKAEKMNVILGIESYLNAAEHLSIIEQVGSKNVKAYMDFCNTVDAGYDVLKEVKQLGRNNICELHIKENGYLLGQGFLPWMKIRDLVYDMGYYGDGWMQIEGAMPPKAAMIDSYKQNLQFLKSLFNKGV